jgi:hypothetical protein
MQQQPGASLLAILGAERTQLRHPRAEGRVVDFASIGSSLPPASITKSNSSPMDRSDVHR